MTWWQVLISVVVITGCLGYLIDLIFYKGDR